MKPAPFEYEAPIDLGGILSLLHQHGADAKVLAGGQSLVPLMNFRLASPAWLVDINNANDLAYVRADTRALRIGALTRHSALENAEAARDRWPIFREALSFLAHPPIRNRGTVGGSVAHADPAAELPTVLAALEARFHLRSTREARTVDWSDFFVTHLTTTMAPDELLVEIEVPVPPPNCGMAFTEFARRHGDFAIGGAAAVIALGGRGECVHSAVSLLGAGSTPVRSEDAARPMLGEQSSASLVDEVVERAVADAHPTGDIHGSERFRRRVLGALVRRAVTTAWRRASLNAGGLTR